MKIRTLVCCILFVIGVNAQTKEAEFAKMQDLLKKSNGIAASGYKVLDYSFSEKVIQMDVEQGGSAFSVIAKKIKWEHFSYSIKKAKDNKEVTEVVIIFDDDIEVLAVQNKKQVQKETDSRIRLYVNTADAKLVEEQLEELKLYTWKELAQIRELTPKQLEDMIKNNITQAVREDNGKLTRLDPCFMTVTFPNREITFQLKNLKVHEKELVGHEALFCFGKEGSYVITKKNSGTVTENMEHPDIILDFEKLKIAPVELQFALKKLSSGCWMNSIL